MTTLYVNGTVHSTSDPYATALLVDGGSVAWVGADDTAAGMRERSGADWEVVDLHGALVVPAFVDSLLSVRAQDDDPAGSGVFLTVTTDAAAGGTPATTGADRTATYRTAAHNTVSYTTVDAAGLPATAAEVRSAMDPDSSVAGLTAVVGGAGLDAASAARLADVATAAGVQVYFRPENPQALDAVLAAVAAAEQTHGRAATGRARHRVSWNGPVSQDAVAGMARLGVSATVVPDAAGVITAPVATLLAHGVPVCLGTGSRTADLWSAIRACLEHQSPDQRISARAGFTAATRAGVRALPAAVADRHGTAGRIAPSAPATFGIWATEALSVQAPDGRVAAWSTDTRAGTPLLPVLEEDTAAPRCLATVVDGTVVYRSPDWS